MEYFTRLTSSTGRAIAKTLRLRHKKTGEVIHLPLYDENALFNVKKNSILADYDMAKLEVEYDYDTDAEQLTQSKKMLLNELM